MLQKGCNRNQMGLENIKREYIEGQIATRKDATRTIIIIKCTKISSKVIGKGKGANSIRRERLQPLSTENAKACSIIPKTTGYKTKRTTLNREIK